MHSFFKFFGKSSKIIIGVIHFPPLLGFIDAASMDIALDNALQDLHAFEQGGVDAIIIENNYDVPHSIHVRPGTIAAMTALGMGIRSHTTLPIGVCVLWNDYESSFAVAKAIDAQFIRIPVFVDHVETDFGSVTGDPDAVSKARSQLQAEDIAMLVDIHVKHAKILSGNTIAEAAAKAQMEKADGLIVTGNWTGEPPSEADLSSVRAAVGDMLVFAGSGADSGNIGNILKYANGAIVSTSLKEGQNATKERNVKSWMQRIDTARVQALVASSHSSATPQ